MENKYMTIPELGNYLHISRKTAYKLIQLGRIPSFRISERKTLVKQSDVDKYVEKYAGK